MIMLDFELAEQWALEDEPRKGLEKMKAWAGADGLQSLPFHIKNDAKKEKSHGRVIEFD